MSMKLLSLTIQPQNTWQDLGENNPLRAVVKLGTENSVLEVVLSNEAMRKMVNLVAYEIAAEAKAKVDEFAATVLALDMPGKALMLEGEPADG